MEWMEGSCRCVPDCRCAGRTKTRTSTRRHARAGAWRMCCTACNQHCCTGDDPQPHDAAVRRAPDAPRPGGARPSTAAPGRCFTLSHPGRAAPSPAHVASPRRCHPHTPAHTRGCNLRTWLSFARHGGSHETVRIRRAGSAGQELDRTCSWRGQTATALELILSTAHAHPQLKVYPPAARSPRPPKLSPSLASLPRARLLTATAISIRLQAHMRLRLSMQAALEPFMTAAARTDGDADVIGGDEVEALSGAFFSPKEVRTPNAMCSPAARRGAQAFDWCSRTRRSRSSSGRMCCTPCSTRSSARPRRHALLSTGPSAPCASSSSRTALAFSAARRARRPQRRARCNLRLPLSPRCADWPQRRGSLPIARASPEGERA